MARGWVRASNTVTTGTNAATNAAYDAGAAAYVPRIPSYRWIRGPVLASVKSPRYWPTRLHASARRPSGAGWSPHAARPGRRLPDISPAPWGQQWRHVSAPRAYPVSRYQR